MMLSIKNENYSIQKKTGNLHSRGNVLDELPSIVKYAQPRRPLLQFKSILSNFPARNEAV
jgi:hypothetical protein